LSRRCKIRDVDCCVYGGRIIIKRHYLECVCGKLDRVNPRIRDDGDAVVCSTIEDMDLASDLVAVLREDCKSRGVGDLAEVSILRFENHWSVCDWISLGVDNADCETRKREIDEAIQHALPSAVYLLNSPVDRNGDSIIRVKIDYHVLVRKSGLIRSKKFRAVLDGPVC